MSWTKYGFGKTHARVRSPVEWARKGDPRAAGSLATTVGIGEALSTMLGGQLIQHVGFHASFLGLAAVTALAFGTLWIAIPETLRRRLL